MTILGEPSQFSIHFKDIDVKVFMQPDLMPRSLDGITPLLNTEQYFREHVPQYLDRYLEHKQEFQRRFRNIEKLFVH